MTDSGTDKAAGRFSLVVGGPFHAILRRLRLTAPDQLPTQRAALGLALLAWLPPALLAVFQSLTDDRYSGWGFFTDWMVYTRYLIAIWIMIATERYADGRLITLAQHFRDARILSDADLPAFERALGIADRRSGSALAEVVILAAVLVGAGVSTHLTVDLVGSGWEGREVGGDVLLSWAGEAARFLSTPLFLFLVLRWIWRFLVWTALLYRISRLPLQLMPLHPDRSAGLGFLAIYPSIFSGFLFALSCVVASAMVTDIALEHPGAEAVWFVLAGWLSMCSVLVLGPLLVFVRPLYAVRERALIEYGRLASRHHLAFHRKWLGEGRSGEELLGSADPSSASDLNATFEAIQRLRFVPVDFPAVLQLLIAAGAPLLVVVATQIPFGDLIKWIFGTIV
ncbi:MAG: hypothetical protein U9Q81_08540 [Pseudomonadota bacterium]|nr:hypothetical protein [Pseudomonadota bacterium]